MLTKPQITYIRSLHQKKFRQMYGKFLVEGDKLVRELLASNVKTDAIYALEGWKNANNSAKYEITLVSASDLERISTHDSPNQVVAIADIPKHEAADLNLAPALYIALDQIQDPGNAGTIIRIADWFGINTVFFSEGSVDVYNPKVVSSAKGSLFRTACHYVNLAQLFEANKALPVYGTFMEGENIYKTELASQGFIVIGNEANGISQEVAGYVTNKISIPNFGKAESLNAAVATGIVVSEFKRK